MGVSESSPFRQFSLRAANLSPVTAPLCLEAKLGAHPPTRDLTGSRLSASSPCPATRTTSGRTISAANGSYAQYGAFEQWVHGMWLGSLRTRRPNLSLIPLMVSSIFNSETHNTNTVSQSNGSDMADVTKEGRSVIMAGAALAE